MGKGRDTGGGTGRGQGHVLSKRNTKEEEIRGLKKTRIRLERAESGGPTGTQTGPIRT